MPHSTNARGSRVRNSHHQPIKQDPDSSATSNSVPDSGTVKFDVARHSSTNSIDGDSSSYMPVDQSFYHQGRSDAPPPSERMTEPEPLLRELRMRPAAAGSIADCPSPGSMDAGESFFHTSFQDIGKKLKACNDTLGELQQLGVSHDVQLPELVLVGDQSAGKSSLMSGLASLDLPRSEGTCTRCPLHIRVSRNNEWSCRVWLRREYSYEPPEQDFISEADVTEEDPFFPWKKLPSATVHEFKTMHDSNDLEKVLRWAQIAILNDEKSHKLFIPGSGSIAQSTPIDKAADEVTAKFSPNIVALEIKGPELPDLSFYDMPGIFQNPADARDDYLVQVVRNLSKDYIQHPSAIILCSMPMNSDAENSATFGLIRRLNALHRTIGVLTKADLIPQGGNHEQWLAIMKGKTHHAGLGYFITSRPHDKDLDALKEWEAGFFANDGYQAVDGWPKEFHQFSERCGVEKLKAFLSERLGEEFAKSLPTIKHKVKAHLDKCTGQLGQLPELPSNVEKEVQISIMSFGELARSELKPAEFSKLFGQLSEVFRDCLVEMKPKFTLKDASDTPVLEISDDESDAGSVAAGVTTPTSKRRSMAPPITPAKRQRTGTPHMASSQNGQIKPEEVRGSVPPRPSPAARGRQPFPEPFTQFSDVGRGFRTLRQVRDEIRAKTRAGMPDIITEEVYNDMCQEAIQPLNGPMEAFLEKILKLLESMLNRALKKSFERLSKRLIYKKCQALLRSYIRERGEEALAALAVVYRLETYGLFTINREAFDRCRKDEQILLTRYRHQMRMLAAGYGDSRPFIPWDMLTDEKRLQDDKRREAEMDKIGPDPFEKELAVVAYVRGYYRLAALRFADSVCLHVTNGMIPEIQRQLPYYLETKLGLRGSDAHQIYENLMAEDEATAAKRETLKKEREKFVRALTSIEELEAGVPPNSSASQSQYEHEQDNAATMSGALQDEC